MEGIVGLEAAREGVLGVRLVGTGGARHLEGARWGCRVGRECTGKGLFKVGWKSLYCRVGGWRGSDRSLRVGDGNILHNNFDSDGMIF